MSSKLKLAPRREKVIDVQVPYQFKRALSGLTEVTARYIVGKNGEPLFQIEFGSGEKFNIHEFYGGDDNERKNI